MNNTDMKNRTTQTTDIILKVNKSNSVRYMTRGVYLFMAAVLIPIMAVSYGDIAEFTLSVVTSIIVLSAVGIFYFISPRSVCLTPEAVVLRRVAGAKVFRYADIAEAGVWTGNPYKMLRTFGCGGVHGFIGWFYGGGMGNHFEYVGNYDEAFFIRLRSGRKYLISCEDSRRAVDTIKSRIRP